MRRRSGLVSGLRADLTCSICGFFIINPNERSRFAFNLEAHGVRCRADMAWLSEVRAFNSKEPFLSGVGRAASALILPLDPRKHRDDENCQDHDTATFGVRVRDRCSSYNVAYPIHESCWQLLHRQAQLYGVEDLTDSRYTKFLYQLHHASLYYPRVDWIDDHGLLLHPGGVLTSTTVSDATFNPLDTEPTSILIERAKAKNLTLLNEVPIFGRMRMNLNQQPPTTTTRPPAERALHALPEEIISLILEHLSMRDLLSLWIASPLVPDYLPQAFWRSRFQHGMELGFFFEFRELWDTTYVHWYTLYWKAKEITSSIHRMPAIRNRRRILAMVDHTVRLTLKYVNKPAEGAPSRRPPVDPILFEANGVSSCRAEMALPPTSEIKELHISTIHFGIRRYITGLRINDSIDGLGFYHPGSCETFRIDTASHGSVQEILCYVDLMGIRGLYLVTDKGQKIGRFNEPASRDLVSLGVLPIGKQLIAHLDATRLIALGTDNILTRPHDSRNQFLWHEYLPPQDVIIDRERHLYHKLLSPDNNPWKIRYNPIEYHVFNTRESLLGITGYVSGKSVNLTGLKFIYQPGDNSKSALTRVFYGVEEGTPMHLSIDGPGGEYLTRIHVMTTKSTCPPILSIFTNYNRSVMFFLEPLSNIEDDILDSRFYAPSQDEYIAGLMLASGNGVPNRIWNFGILCRPCSVSRS